MLDAGRHGHRLVGGLLHAHGLTAAHEAVRGEQHLGLGVLQPRGDGLRAVAGEARRVHRADAGHGEHRDGGLGGHGQEDPDGIAGADAQSLQRIGEPVDLGVQLPERERAHAAVLGLADDGWLVATRGEVAIDAVGGEVQLAAEKPARPREPARHVEDLREGRRPRQAHVLADRAPVPLRVVDRSRVEGAEGVDVEAVTCHEAAETGAARELGSRTPQDVGHGEAIR
jgi:hypothetical protein